MATSPEYSHIITSVAGSRRPDGSVPHVVTTAVTDGAHPKEHKMAGWLFESMYRSAQVFMQDVAPEPTGRGNSEIVKRTQRRRLLIGRNKVDARLTFFDTIAALGFDGNDQQVNIAVLEYSKDNKKLELDGSLVG